MPIEDEVLVEETQSEWPEPCETFGNQTSSLTSLRNYSELRNVNKENNV